MVSITGLIATDPTARIMKGGTLIVQFCITTEEDGDSGWTQVVMFRKVAERAAAVLRRGSHITVEGILKLSPWVDKDNITRWSKRMIAIHMEVS